MILQAVQSVLNKKNGGRNTVHLQPHPKHIPGKCKHQWQFTSLQALKQHSYHNMHMFDMYKYACTAHLTQASVLQKTKLGNLPHPSYLIALGTGAKKLSSSQGLEQASSRALNKGKQRKTSEKVAQLPSSLIALLHRRQKLSINQPTWAFLARNNRHDTNAECKNQSRTRAKNVPCCLAPLATSSSLLFTQIDCYMTVT